MLTSVGAATRAAEGRAEARDAILGEAQVARDSVAGVNLDEEAANLLRYEQAYQAAARIIAVADEVFRTLLSAVGR
jgi:flagellar hook-associated protein 1 FlgK